MDLYENFKEKPLTEKLQLMKHLLWEVVGVSILGCVFFLICFCLVWVLTLFINPSPYYAQRAPNFFIEPLDEETISTILINAQVKNSLCESGVDSLFSYQEVSFHTYCNVEHSELPDMSKPTNVQVQLPLTSDISFVGSCIKLLNKKTECVKYPTQQRMMLWREVKLEEVMWMKLKLKLREKNQLIHGVKFDLTEETSLISRLIKDHYHLISVVLSYGIAIICTIAVVIWRVGYVITILGGNIQEQSHHKKKT